MNQPQFPLYLLYGFLDPASVRTTDEGLLAEYHAFDTKVLEVVLHQSGAFLYEIWEGERISITVAPTLKQAALQYGSNLDAGQNPLLLRMVMQTCKLGNAYFTLPFPPDQKKRTLFYPAGILFLLCLPLTDANRNAVAQVVQSPLFAHRTTYRYATAIHSLEPPYAPLEQLEVVEWVAPLAYVPDLVAALAAAGAILPQVQHRMVIREIGNKASEQWQVFPNPTPGYMIRLEGLPTGVH